MELLKRKSPRPYIDTGLVFVARVVAAEHGRATHITMLHDDQAICVCGHGAMVSKLVADDKVTVLLTADGAIIHDRICADDENPKQAFSVNRDGSLSLDVRAGFEMKTAFSTFTMSQVGNVTLNGKNVETNAKVENSIRGGVIRIN